MVFLSSALAYSPQFVDKEKSIRLRWKENKIPIYISKSFSDKAINIRAKSDVLGAIQRSLKHWEDVADIEFEILFSDKESVNAKDSKGDGISLISIAPTSENLLFFEDNIDSYSAMTRLFYNSKGEIQESDIILNPIQLFTTDGTFGTFDLEATLTHEIGHLLGLGHSQVLGSTMHSHQGTNGIYNLPSFSSRTLSADDKAGAISLYGNKKADDNCCGRIEGKISIANSRIIREMHVWAEDSQTGRVIAGISTDPTGKYVLSGLPKSIYNLYVQDKQGISTTISLGEIDLSEAENKILNKKIRYEPKNFEAQYIGFNGQLSNLAVPVNAGKSYIIYVGGKNINPEQIELGFHTDYLKVNRSSIIKHNYGENISVMSFEVEIGENTPIGEYSIFLKNGENLIEHFIGGITVEETVNPWNNKPF